jgi:predicted Zn-dependent peptidase
LIGPDFDQEFRTRAEIETLWSTLKMGGRLAWSTSFGTTTFRLSGLAAFRDGLIWRLGWILGDGTYDDDSIAAYNKRRRTRDRERRVAARVTAALYGDRHPGAHARDTRVTRTQLEGFKSSSYRAGGASVVLVGKLDAAAVNAQIDRVFGGWRPLKPTAPSSLPPPVARSRPALLEWVDDSIQQPTIEISIAYEPGGHAEHAERLVTADMLEQQVFAVRSELGASYDLSAWHQREVGGSRLRLSADLAVERAAEATRKLVRLIAGFNTPSAVRRGQFVRARRRVLVELLDEMSHPAGLARLLEHVAENRLGVDYWPAVAQAVAGLTIDRLTTRVDLDRAVIVVRGPAAAVKRITGALGDVERIEVSR